jgi:hypothetical protein
MEMGHLALYVGEQSSRTINQIQVTLQDRVAD